MLDKAVAFIMLPVYTRFLTPTDYGLLQLVSMTLEVASIFAGSRLASGLFRYYHKAETQHEKQRVLTTAFILITTTYFVTAAVVWGLGAPLSGFVLHDRVHVNLIHIGVASFALQSFLVVPLSYFQLRQRPTVLVVLNTVKLVLQVTLNVVFVVFMGMGAEGVLLTGLVANVVIGSSVAVMLFRAVGFGFSSRAARDLLRFGIPMVGTQIAGFVLTMGDRYFLQQSGDTAIVGLYGLAYQFGFLLTTVGYGPFSAAWTPIRFQIAKQSDRDSIYSNVFVYFNLLLLTAALAIALFVKDVLVIMADPAFHQAATMVPVILVAYVLYAWTKFHNFGILMSERTEFVTLANWVGAAFALAGYVLLVPRYLGLGAAWATLIAFAIRYVIIYISAQRLWRVQYEWTPVVRLTLIAGVVYAASFAIRTDELILSLALRAGLLVVYAVAVWFGGVLSNADRCAVRLAVASPRLLLARMAG